MGYNGTAVGSKTNWRTDKQNGPDRHATRVTTVHNRHDSISIVLQRAVIHKSIHCHAYKIALTAQGTRQYQATEQQKELETDRQNCNTVLKTTNSLEQSPSLRRWWSLSWSEHSPPRGIHKSPILNISIKFILSRAFFNTEFSNILSFLRMSTRDHFP